MSLQSGKRYAAVLIAAGITLPLAGCGWSDDEVSKAAQDVTSVSREQLRPGGTVRWAVDDAPETFNVFQADADEATGHVAGAVLPQLFTLDERGTPQANPDYIESAEVTERSPKQTVVYRLNPKAVWSDGRPIGVEDFEAQWLALNGEDSAYWTARNSGYDRIESVSEGEEEGEVEVVFKEPYADWQGLFSPLYPMTVMSSPEAFNDTTRTGLPEVAGPFMIKKTAAAADAADAEEAAETKGKRGKKAAKRAEKRAAKRAAESRDAGVTLVRNPRWWGDRALLDSLVFQPVPRGAKREAALAAGRVGIGEVDRDEALEAAKEAKAAAARVEVTRTDRATDDKPDMVSLPKEGSSKYTVHKALAPEYTQFALNGSSGPLADEQVRRAIARAVDRGTLARSVLGPHDLPAEPLGSHLLLPGQPGYDDQSGALGEQDVQAAQELLADAGWEGGPQPRARTADAADAASSEDGGDGGDGGEAGDADSKQGVVFPSYDIPIAVGRSAETQHIALSEQAKVWRAAAEHGRTSSAYRKAKKAAKATGAALISREQSVAQPPRQRPFVKDGKPLTLRFVVPEGPGAGQLRDVATRIVRMLDNVGVRTRVVEAEGESYFKDYIAAGQYDIALYSWPGTAYPATDAQPIYAKPVPAADGSLVVEQNYTRVGTDEIDQLFDQAAAELDGDAARELLGRADGRIWAAAGSVPLFQRPELVATAKGLANAGAFGFATPRYQDIGYRS